MKSLALLALVLSFEACLGVKFQRKGIHVDTDSLSKGAFSSLTCNYIKWKQETVSKVLWTMGVSGDTIPMFTSHFETGEKETPDSRLFTVDPSGSGERLLRLRIDNLDSPEVTVCCEVEAVRDSGYGVLKRIVKGKCQVINLNAGPDLELDLDVNRNSAQPGDQLIFTCEANYLPSASVITVYVNNIPQNTSSTENVVMAHLNVREDHFSSSNWMGSSRDDSINAECSISRAGEALETKTVTVGRSRFTMTTTTEAPVRFQGRFGGSDFQAPRNSRGLWTDPQSHKNHGNVPCHNYVIVRTQGNLVHIEGEPIQEVVSYLNLQTSYDGSYRPLDSKAANVLNIFGYNGYKVVGMVTVDSNRDMAWTLEREYYEYHNEL